MKMLLKLTVTPRRYAKGHSRLHETFCIISEPSHAAGEDMHGVVSEHLAYPIQGHGGGLVPIPADIGRRRGTPWDRSPDYHRADT